MTADAPRTVPSICFHMSNSGASSFRGAPWREPGIYFSSCSRGVMDSGFDAYASSRNDGVSFQAHGDILAAQIRPSCASTFRPDIRGRRECRAPVAPAALRAKIKSTQASHHGHTGDIRHSPRNGFNGFLRGLPGEPGLLPPWPAAIATGLIPASGYQDATTSPSTTRAFVSCACRVHRISCPTFCDDRETPLMRAEDARKSAGDLPAVTSETDCGTLARRANQL